jgi:succinate-acetate transporter protein
MQASATMETAHGMQDAPPKMEEKPEWWASTGTLGLMGFGLTTILAGLTVGKWIGADAVLSMALFFGGGAQIIAGIIELRKGNMFAGTAFTSYGSFWFAFAWLNTTYAALSNGYDPAAFFFVWALFTLTFFMVSWKHGIGVTLVFLTLLIAFILLTVNAWETAANTPLMKSAYEAIGAEIVITGLLAWLTATANLVNWQFARKILPI